ncbi:MAG: electron transport complex subunit RsxC, partial [Thermodesulfobacteriota bacterium]
MALKTFKHGIHPEYCKELASGKKIETAPIPKRVIIPLQQHVGAPCSPLVKKGEEVSQGQKIGDTQAFVSSPVHASISGKVKDIAPCPYPVGGKINSIIIEGDGSSPDYPEEKEISLDPEALSPDDIRLKVREAGIIGMGGAAFPTHVKLTPPKGVKIDTVVINACECEPYLTADHRLMVEESQRLMWGIKVVMKAVGAKRAVIGVEVNKPDAIDALKKELNAFPNIELVSLETKYPQGAEKMLIKAVLDRCVPVGKLPFDVGVVVNNVGTMVAIYHALSDSRPLIERVVTVTGKGIKEPKNLKLKVGTTFKEAIDLCGGLTANGKTKVLMGGPMMGIAQMDLSVPV